MFALKLSSNMTLVMYISLKVHKTIYAVFTKGTRILG